MNVFKAAVKVVDKILLLKNNKEPDLKILYRRILYAPFKIHALLFVTVLCVAYSLTFSQLIAYIFAHTNCRSSLYK